MKIGKFVACAAIVMGVVTAFAQGAHAGGQVGHAGPPPGVQKMRPGGPGGPGGQRRGMLSPEMVKKLALTKAQEAKIKGIMDAFRAKMKDVPREQRMGKFKDIQKQIMAVLTPKQKKVWEAEMKARMAKMRQGGPGMRPGTAGGPGVRPGTGGPARAGGGH